MSIFKGYKFHCHSLGKLMTNLPCEQTIIDLENKIFEQEKERDTLVNANGNKIKWTEAKETNLNALKERLKREQSNELSTGVISELDSIFNAVYWERKQLLDTKEIRKGLSEENEGIKLINWFEGTNLSKNETRYYNEYLSGEPDLIHSRIDDNKCSYSLESFDNKEKPTNDNIWQIKAYIWLMHSNGIKVDNVGRVYYTLVNNSLDEIKRKVDYLNNKYYVNNCIEESTNDEKEIIEYYKDLRQLYHNNIFDVKAFKEKNKPFDLEFPIRDMPKSRRIKFFEVEYTEKDKENMINRLDKCREYLIKKEEEQEKFYELDNKINNR